MLTHFFVGMHVLCHACASAAIKQLCRLCVLAEHSAPSTCRCFVRLAPSAGSYFVKCADGKSPVAPASQCCLMCRGCYAWHGPKHASLLSCLLHRQLCSIGHVHVAHAIGDRDLAKMNGLQAGVYMARISHVVTASRVMLRAASALLLEWSVQSW